MTQITRKSYDPRDFSPEPKELLDPWRALCRFRMRALGITRVRCSAQEDGLTWKPAGVILDSGRIEQSG